MRFSRSEAPSGRPDLFFDIAASGHHGGRGPKTSPPPSEGGEGLHNATACAAGRRRPGGLEPFVVTFSVGRWANDRARCEAARARAGLSPTCRQPATMIETRKRRTRPWDANSGLGSPLLLVLGFLDAWNCRILAQVSREWALCVRKRLHLSRRRLRLSLHVGPTGDLDMTSALAGDGRHLLVAGKSSGEVFRYDGAQGQWTTVHKYRTGSAGRRPYYSAARASLTLDDQNSWLVAACSSC